MPKGYTFETQEERDAARKQSQRRYYDKNTVAISGKIRSSERLRRAIVDMLGSVCVKCGYADLRALQIDHVYGGGNQAQKTIGYYKMLRQIFEGLEAGEGFSDYQVLCANCNTIKRLEAKECMGSGRPKLPRTDN